MKQYANLKVGMKLLLGFILVALISGAMGFYAIVTLKGIDNSHSRAYTHMTVPLSEIARLSAEFQKIRVSTRDIILAQTPEEIQFIADEIIQRREHIDQLSKSFEKTILSDRMRTEFDNLTQASIDYGKGLDKLIVLARENRDAEAHALLGKNGDLGIAVKTEQEIIDRIVTMKTEDAGINSKENTEATNRTIMIMTGVILFVIILSVLIGLYISSLITKPLKRVVRMIEEMSRGHLTERLHINTKDEIGLMASTMDGFADHLQSDVITIMNKISEGDVSMGIMQKDDLDEITPALKKTVETIRGLDNEIQRLIKAVTEGNLDARGNADLYSGTWKQLIEGTNGLVDAFVGPINVTAEYVERISKGDIPPAITDTYSGDFNEIKNNLNNCVHVMSGLLDETGRLIEAAQAGKLDIRGSAETFNGEWGSLVKGINDLIDAFVGPINVTAEYVNRIGKGEIPPVITDTYHGDFNEIKNSINSCINGLGGLAEGKEVLGRMSVNDFTTRVEGVHQGIFAEMGKSINILTDGINTITHTINNAARGDLKDLEELKRVGKRSENDTLMPAIIQLTENIKALVDEATMLSSSAIEGKLEIRGNVGKFEGEYAKVISGVNDTLDAVIEPVKEALSVLKEMANGNLQVSISGDYKGDHAEIKNALNETIESLLSYVSEISSILSEIGGGNLDLVITSDYKGDFIAIKNALNNIILSLNQVLGDINDAADQVSQGSRQVSDGSQALSQGSTEQASSIEELTASISEIASQTKQNAVNANQANELAVSAKNVAVQGNDQMKDMLAAITDINVASANISKIIKVIDDIAFQTNILALNAAVEAARAGQHGKGFAVVAEEVRNLAARSADAAKETTDLIEGSINKVQTGTEIANETADALKEIVSGIEKAAALVGEIAKASNEQAGGISQVNRGIEQVSQVIQNNSATAEQSAAASEELSGQAEILKQMVNRFKLNKKMSRYGFEGQRLPENKNNSFGCLSGGPQMLLINEDSDKY